ncbi:hypothetical protein EVG20_g907 [Dentipellis fragilis]|uniref:Xylanolytic transcriptional activator regulatory domain-containing protein n=1 Tax=Dentipellis fragilis TaxID=205917 RepID=A0A4Y9ZEC4_9AGAM|nr:hypothetical protein EVG20_g907 [Dentipellis fragilis]
MPAGTPNEMDKDKAAEAAEADQSTHVASTSSAITPASEPSEPAASGTRNSHSKPKVKRNRIVLSCQRKVVQLFIRRKQQVLPCATAAIHVKDALAEVQHTFANTSSRKRWGKGSTTSENGFPEDLGERVNQLEGLVSNTLSSLEPSALAGLDALLQIMHSAIASPSPPTSSSDLSDPSQVNDAVQVAAAALGQLSQQNTTDLISASPPFGPIAEILHNMRTSPLVGGSGTSGTFGDLGGHFPNQKITNFLMTYFFESSSVHWLWPFIHRPCFESYYRTFSSAPLPPSIEFTALLAVTCATALQFLPETDQDAITFADYPQGRHVMRQRLYEFARSVLVASTHPPTSSIERVQALGLFAIYQWVSTNVAFFLKKQIIEHAVQQNEGNAGECYYIASVAIRMAQTLAMNRDGVTTWHMRPDDAEVRRRLWWSLFIIDRFHCIEYSRPYVILDQHTDVALPMNLDQAEIRDIGDLVSKPMDEPTDSLFHVLQTRFAQLAGQLWDQCFAITLPTYCKVMELEDQFRKFEIELPASFRYQSTQAALARPYLRFQASMYHGRANLLRPFLFIRPSKSGPNGISDQDAKLYTFHVHARTICLIFCKRILSLLQLFQSQIPRAQLRWTTLVLHAYDTALMLAVAIIMDPENSGNEELEEWITLARSLLEDLGTYNVLAPNALQHIDVIQKRTAFVLSMTADSRTPATASCSSVNPFLTDPTLQRIERATRVLSQAQPSLADLLGHELASDAFWATLRPGVFAGHFPGIESLSGPINPQNLEHFLDSCLSMQSRLPPIFAF